MTEKDYQKSKIKLSTWKTLLSQERHRFKYFAIIIACGMLLGILDLCASLLNMRAIDDYIAVGSLEGFGGYAALIVLVQLGFAFLAFGFCTAAGRLEGHMTADLREKAFKKLQTMSFSYYDKSNVGYLLSRLTSDISRATETVSWSCIDLGWGVMSIIASLIGMFTVNPRLSVIIITAVPFIAVISVFFQKKIIKHQRETRRLNSMIISGFNEGIMGAATTKTLVREDLNYKEFSAVTGRMRRASFSAAMVSALYLPVASLIISMATATILLRGGHDVQNGLITIGQLNFFINIGNMMFEPIRSFAGIFAEFQSCQAAAERVADVLEAQSDIVDPPEIEEKYGDIFTAKRENWEPVRGEVEFKDVTFQYIDGEKVLKNFNLHVNPGESIALVGETGSGKSTIVNLVCRFYEPQRGQVLIDGKDVRDRSQLWLQSNLGYVLQAPHLFSGTIAENIRYGRLDATDDDIRKAAMTVGAHEFIQTLEKGYDTEVGEGGSLLSTGQKQLVSFARAIIADPAIFVLDEATSSIDTESEMKIQAAIETLLSSRTSFIVAHRLSTIRNADRILVIGGGEILESGSHAQLMAQRGRYYNLYINRFVSGQVEQSVQAI